MAVPSSGIRNVPMADSDTLYHRLYSHPLMVEQLVRDFVPEAMAAGLDFSRMQRVNAKFHGRRGKRREGDVIWRLPTGDGVDIYLYLLFEFQSQSDWWMAVRTQVYEGLLWQHIVAEKKLKAGDRLPPVLLLTLYNGEQRWTAPTAVADLIALPPDSPLWPFQPQVRYHVLDMGAFPGDELVRQAIEGLGASVAVPDDLVEMKTMLATQGKEWKRQWTAEGETKGKAEMLLRLLRRRFHTVPSELEARVRKADDAQLDEWSDRFVDAKSLTDVFTDLAH